jgi:hypothetical protein
MHIIKWKNPWHESIIELLITYLGDQILYNLDQFIVGGGSTSYLSLINKVGANLKKIWKNRRTITYTHKKPSAPSIIT